MGLAIGIFLFLLVVGAPIAIALGLAATITLELTSTVPIATVAQRIFASLNSFTLLAIPFFIFAGLAMDAGGLSKRMIDFAAALVGWLTGSLLHIAVLAATGLAAISGSGTADTAAVSSILGPEFKRRRYDQDFAAALIACAGSQAQIIPPSLIMVIIATTANLSVGAMFLAGIIPGILTTSALHLAAHFHASRGGAQYKVVEHFSLRRVWDTFLPAIPALFMPVIVLGGIVGGVFTPTEAASVAAVFALIVGLFIYRDLRWSAIPALVNRTVGYSSAILLIIGTASILGWIMAEAQLPQRMETWIGTTVSEPWSFLLLMMVLLLIIGAAMESIAVILILSPILIPIAEGFGINPIHFALIMVMNLAIGTVTPPLGGALFTASTIMRRDVLQVSKRLFWPLIAMIIPLLLVTYIPDLALMLPRAAGLIE